MRQTSHKPRADYPSLVYGVLKDILPVMTDERLQRFEDKIDASGGLFVCHAWLGGRTKAGYGLFQGSIGYYGYSFLAHRIAWALRNGREPGSAWLIRHSCDNPPCCNPRHLLIGDHRDNTQDMISRGRSSLLPDEGKCGPEANAADFSAADRELARSLRYESSWSITAIADRIGCHRATITRWLALHERSGG